MPGNKILDATSTFSPRHHAILRDYPQMDNALFESRFLHCKISDRDISVAPAEIRSMHICTKIYFGGDIRIFTAPPSQNAILSATTRSWKWTMLCSNRDSCTVTAVTVVESRFVSQMNIMDNGMFGPRSLHCKIQIWLIQLGWPRKKEG